MKKIITTLIVLLTITCFAPAQTAWNNYKVTSIAGTGNYSMSSDTMYVGISCRNGKYQAMYSSSLTNGLAAMGLPSPYAAGDSITWRIVKGVALGTTPRVRFINVKTGQYLYQGLNGGTTKVGYLAPLNDPNNGVKDFQLINQGTDNKNTYYYYIDDGGSEFFNDATGVINIKTGFQGWKFVPRQGPQPKTVINTPSMGLGTTQTTFNAGGNVTLNAAVTKGATDLLGLTLLYHGTSLIDTLSLDASGNGSFTYNGLNYGTEKFTVVYTGDVNYGPQDSTITLTVGPSLNAKPTKVLITTPTTSELYKDVTINVTAKTSTDGIVNKGNVILFVNNIAKNNLPLDSLGNASVVFPNLLVGTENFKAVYIGNKVDYLDSDTASTSLTITASTSTVKPYPVYFDLGQEPEIRQFNVLANKNGVKTRPYSFSFRTDSLPSITVTDTINNAFKVQYNALGTTYDKIDNCYNNADNIIVPLGSSRPLSVKIKTPWLNAGSYNIYISHRVNTTGNRININSVTLDGKECYYPSQEMYGRWFRSWDASNSKRRWNAKSNSNSMAMNYLGSVSTNTGSHLLKISVNNENGASITMDMLQFIPVDMDSVSINDTATIDMAKIYYPMFSWTGFPYQPGYDAATVAATYSDYTNLGVAYQVPDPTDWGTKYSYTIDSVGIDTIMISGAPYTANYVTVYRAEDKWTRVSEGYSNGTSMNYTCQLPAGNYYYQTINYTDLGDGAYDYRTFVNDGYFSLPLTATNNIKSSNIKAYGFNKMLTVRNIQAGAKIMVVDLMGRVISSTVSSSNIYTQKIASPAVYIVKVISGNDNLVTKVLIE